MSWPNPINTELPGQYESRSRLVPNHFWARKQHKQEAVMSKTKLKVFVGILLVLSIMCQCIGTLAEPVSGTYGSTVSWSYDPDSNKLEITGTGTISSGDSWKDYKSKITSVVIGEGITGLSGGIFQDYPSLTSVSLPASLTSISSDPHPFIYSPSVKSISVASGNTSFVSVDGVLFNKAKSTLLICPGGKEGSYTIPSSVTEIKQAAFLDCQTLTNISIPSSVNKIEDHAFYRCYALKKANVPAGVTSLEKSVFEQCKALIEVSLPAGLKSIGVWAFWGCESLKEVTIPDGVTDLGEEVFQGCKSLTKAVIPDSVKSIGRKAFDTGSSIVIYCSKGSPADTYAQANNLQISYTGEYSGSQDPVSETPVTGTAVSLDVGETRNIERNATLPGTDLFKEAFKATSSNENVAKVLTIARGGNIIYADEITYYFTLGIKGISPGTATITLYDNSKTTIIWQGIVKVNGDGTETETTDPGTGEQQTTDPGTGTGTGEQQTTDPGTGTGTGDQQTTDPGTGAGTGEQTVTPTSLSEQVTLKKISIDELSASKNKIKVEWKKLSSKERKKAKNIEIQVSRDKNFTKDVITKTVKSSKTSVTIKGLKKGKKYYVRIRTFTETKEGKIVSKWSKTKNIKTKKK